EFVEDRVCFVRGAVDRTREEPGLILTRILSVEQAQRELTKGLVLSLRLGIHEPEVIDAIGRMLERSQGSCPVVLAVRDSMGSSGLVEWRGRWRMSPGTGGVADLEMLLGQGAVKFSGPVNGHARNGG